jgi:tRNA threonylcarbamoyl adenosine modification protein YeaZ
MRALSIDTSTYRAQIALWTGSACAAREEHDDPSRHAEALLGMVDRAFASAGWRKTDLDLIVVCVGPGSFTGLRAGVATAKGIALALDRPVVGVSGLEAMARAFVRQRPELAREVDAVIALLDARKGEVFWAAYNRDGERLEGPEHIASSSFGSVMDTLPPKKFAGGPKAAPSHIVLVGELASDVASKLGLPDKSAGEVRPLTRTIVHRSPETDLPDACEVARLGVRAFERRGADDLDALEPIYVRPPDITLPKPK